MNQIKTKDKEDLLAVTTPLKEKIEDLNFRVTSIERRMPGAGPTYLDITSINVPSGSDIRKSLGPPRYTSFDNDGFFIAIPKGNWTFAVTDELSYLKSMYSFLDKTVQKAPSLEKIAEAPLFMWQGSSKAKIYTNDGEISFTYRPSISVEPITKQLIKDRMKMVLQMKSETDTTTEEITKTIDELSTKIKKETADIERMANENKSSVQANNAPKNQRPDNEVSDNAKEITKEVLAKSEEKQEILATLAKLANGDITAFLLFDSVGSMMAQNAALPLRHRILSLQQKGNVFYIQEQITFNDVDVSVDDAEKKHVNSASVDQEILFFSNGKGGYLVKILLQPVPDRADNFTWSKSWLAGLEIPID